MPRPGAAPPRGASRGGVRSRGWPDRRSGARRRRPGEVEEVAVGRGPHQEVARHAGHVLQGGPESAHVGLERVLRVLRVLVGGQLLHQEVDRYDLSGGECQNRQECSYAIRPQAARMVPHRDLRRSEQLYRKSHIYRSVSYHWSPSQDLRTLNGRPLFPIPELTWGEVRRESEGFMEGHMPLRGARNHEVGREKSPGHRSRRELLPDFTAPGQPR